MTAAQPVPCARCGRPWTEHRTTGLPAAGCRGFLWIDPTGPSPTYGRRSA